MSLVNSGISVEGEVINTNVLMTCSGHLLIHFRKCNFWKCKNQKCKIFFCLKLPNSSRKSVKKGVCQNLARWQKRREKKFQEECKSSKLHYENWQKKFQAIFFFSNFFFIPGNSPCQDDAFYTYVCPK